jgi:hypothetical protein
MSCIPILFGLRIFLDWPTRSRAIGRAVEEFQTAVKMSGEVTFASAALGHLYGTVGKTAEARAIFGELSARANSVYVPARGLTHCAATRDSSICCIECG